MKLSRHTVLLHLKDPFTISRETKTVKENVIVRVSEGGHSGVGEAAPSAFYGQSVKTVSDALDVIAGSIEEYEGHPESLCEKLDHTWKGDMAARAAVDVALHDLAAKRAGLPLHAYLGLTGEITALTSFTLGIDSPEVMLKKVNSAKEYPILKVKLGFKGDIDVLETVREAYGGVIRVDANGGWSLKEAMDRFPFLISQGVEFVEQPLPKGERKGLKALRDRFSLPIFVDEDAVGVEDVPGLAGVVDGINVKLMKCGGLRRALRMIKEAREGDLKVMLGCMIETSVGITAAAHLASTADYLDLDGNLLVEDDPFEGVKCINGRLLLPDAPGLGVTEK